LGDVSGVGFFIREGRISTARLWVGFSQKWRSMLLSRFRSPQSSHTNSSFFINAIIGESDIGLKLARLRKGS
jgi:hypothetical protein